jgi:hypothetical protein
MTTWTAASIAGLSIARIIGPPEAADHRLYTTCEYKANGLRCSVEYQALIAAADELELAADELELVAG